MTEKTVLSQDTVNNTSSYEELIRKTVDIETLPVKLPQNIGEPDAPTIDQIDQDIGIECLRETPAISPYKTGVLYSIHKVKQGGLLYLYYKPAGYANDQKTRDIPRLFAWHYVKKSLSYADFASVKEGVSIEDVEKIDPATR